MIGWWRKWRAEREAVRREAEELVAQLGAEAALWTVRLKRRDRLLGPYERQRLDRVMHRIYKTEDIYCPADRATADAYPRMRRRR